MNVIMSHCNFLMHLSYSLFWAISSLLVKALYSSYYYSCSLYQCCICEFWCRLGFLLLVSCQSFRHCLCLFQRGRKRRNQQKSAHCHCSEVQIRRAEHTQTLVFHSVPVKYQCCTGENSAHNHIQLKGGLWGREARSRSPVPGCWVSDQESPPGMLIELNLSVISL